MGELPESMDSEETLATPVEKRGVETFLKSAGAFDPGDLPEPPSAVGKIKEFPPVKLAKHKDTKGVLDVHSLAEKPEAEPEPMQLAGQSVQRRKPQSSINGYEIVADENRPPKDWPYGPDQWKQAVQNVRRKLGVEE